MSCAECLNHVGHDPRCPAAPDEAPDFDDLDDAGKAEWLVEEHSADELAKMLIEACNRADRLESKAMHYLTESGTHLGRLEDLQQRFAAQATTLAAAIAAAKELREQLDAKEIAIIAARNALVAA